MTALLERNFLWFGVVIAIIVTVAFIIWAEWWEGNQVVDVLLADRRTAIYGAVAAIFGSLLGFAIAAESIVLGLSGSDSLEIVRKSSHYKTLWKVFISTIRWLGIATAVSLMAMVFDQDQSPLHGFLYLFVFSASLATLRLVSCVWVLERVVMVVSEDHSGDSSD